MSSVDVPQRYMGAQIGALNADDITLAGVEPQTHHGQMVPGSQHTRIRYVSNRPLSTSSPTSCAGCARHSP